MEEKKSKKEKLTKEERKERRKKFWSENKEIIVQAGIGLLGFIGTIIDVVSIGVDHKMAREDQDRERAMIHDNLNDVTWYLEEPLTNEETKEIIRRRNDGEDMMDILENMGKI